MGTYVLKHMRRCRRYRGHETVKVEGSNIGTTALFVAFSNVFLFYQT